jgi:hypothetical protein
MKLGSTITCEQLLVLGQITCWFDPIQRLGCLDVLGVPFRFQWVVFLCRFRKRGLADYSNNAAQLFFLRFKSAEAAISAEASFICAEAKRIKVAPFCRAMCLNTHRAWALTAIHFNNPFLMHHASSFGCVSASRLWPRPMGVAETSALTIPTTAGHLHQPSQLLPMWPKNYLLKPQG